MNKKATMRIYNRFQIGMQDMKQYLGREAAEMWGMASVLETGYGKSSFEIASY